MMGIWGAFLEPNKPYILPLNVDGFRKSLKITQASLVHNHGATCTVRCVVGNKDPIYICKLSPTQYWCCKLDLRFDGSENVSLISDADVHLRGYFISPGYVDGIITNNCSQSIQLCQNRTTNDLEKKFDDSGIHSFGDRSNINQSEDDVLVVKDSEDEGVTGNEQKPEKNFEGSKDLFTIPGTELRNDNKQSDNNTGLDVEARSLNAVAGTNLIRSQRNLKKQKKTVKTKDNQSKDSDMANGIHPEKVDIRKKKIRRHKKDECTRKKKKYTATEETTLGCHARELHLAEESDDQANKGPPQIVCKNRNFQPITDIDHTENHSLMKNETNQAVENRKIFEADAQAFHSENDSVGRKVDNCKKKKSKYIVKQRKNDDSNGKTSYGAFGY